MTAPWIQPCFLFYTDADTGRLRCSGYNLFTFICFHRKDPLMTIILPLSPAKRDSYAWEKKKNSSAKPSSYYWSPQVLPDSRLKVFTSGPVCTVSFTSNFLVFIINESFWLRGYTGKRTKRWFLREARVPSLRICIATQKVVIQCKLLVNTVVTVGYTHSLGTMSPHWGGRTFTSQTVRIYHKVACRWEGPRGTRKERLNENY